VQQNNDSDHYGAEKIGESFKIARRRCDGLRLSRVYP